MKISNPAAVDSLSKRERKRILFLSNGYAEDLIAAAIIEKLAHELPQIEIKALPLVGEGKAYEPLRTLILGPRKLAPSGGFAGVNPLYLARDIISGWLGWFREEIRVLRAERDAVDLVVCVGDVFLILLSSLFVKRPIIFLPTAKSDYAKRPKQHHGIEKWLIKRSCRLVLPRDKLTTRSLQNFGVRAIYVGNVMMDCLKITGEDFGTEKARYVVGILPGSKRDAYDNFPIILDAVVSIEKRVSFSGRIHFLLALPASLSLEKLISVAFRTREWKITETISSRQGSGLIAHLISPQGSIIKIIGGKFGDLLNRSQVIIGLSGMGNEQAVGLGKPVVSFPGKGPQVTEKFLRIQQTLLGGAVSIVDRDREAVADKICSLLLKNRSQLREIVRRGKERMGGFGAAERVAKLIKKEILVRTPP
ncbi:MAG: lipid-A-disaccharide synthase-related protein [bacterium]